MYDLSILAGQKKDPFLRVKRCQSAVRQRFQQLHCLESIPLLTWDMAAIKKRKQSMIEAAMEIWSLDNI